MSSGEWSLPNGYAVGIAICHQPARPKKRADEGQRNLQSDPKLCSSLVHGRHHHFDPLFAKFLQEISYLQERATDEVTSQRLIAHPPSKPANPPSPTAPCSSALGLEGTVCTRHRP